MVCTCKTKTGYDHAEDCPAFMRRYTVPRTGTLSDPMEHSPSPTDADVEHARRERIVRRDMSTWFTRDFVNGMYLQLERSQPAMPSVRAEEADTI